MTVEDVNVGKIRAAAVHMLKLIKSNWMQQVKKNLALIIWLEILDLAHFTFLLLTEWQSTIEVDEAICGIFLYYKVKIDLLK